MTGNDCYLLRTYIFLLLAASVPHPRSDLHFEEPSGHFRICHTAWLGLSAAPALKTDVRHASKHLDEKREPSTGLS